MLINTLQKLLQDVSYAIWAHKSKAREGLSNCEILNYYFLQIYEKIRLFIPSKSSKSLQGNIFPEEKKRKEKIII